MIVDTVVAPPEVEVVVRIAHFDFDGVAGLMFFDADATFADLVALGDYLGFDRVLVPGGDADVSVGRLDAQVGLAAEGISLRPFVGVSGRCGNQDCSQNGEG